MASPRFKKKLDHSFQMCSSVTGSNIFEMGSKDVLSIKWKDFQENMSSSLGSLRENQDFTDVTLACEDGFQVEVHKVILAASSPFFKNLLRQNDRNYVLIYMRGSTSIDIVNMIDFLYYGEVRLEEKDLEHFLAMGEELRLEGLTNTSDLQPQSEVKSTVSETGPNSLKIEPLLSKPNTGKQIESMKNLLRPENFNNDEKSKFNISDGACQGLVEEKEMSKNKSRIKSESVNGTEDLKSNGKTLEKLKDDTNNGTKENKGYGEVETEGNTFPCDLCDKKYKTYNHLNTHKNSKHEEKKYMCDECEYQSAWHSHFLRHKQSKHGFSQPRNGRMNYCD